MRVCLLGYHENFFWAGSATLKVQKNVHKYLNLNSVDADLYLCSESKNHFSVLFESLKFIERTEGKVISGGVIPFIMYLIKSRYDVMHMIVTRNYMVIVALMNLLLRKKQFVTFHDTLIFPDLPKFDFSTMKSFLVKWILTMTSNAVLLFNQNDIECFKSKFPRKKTVLIKNGVEQKYFEGTNLISNRKNILYAGGINKSYKGFEFLVNALKKTKSQVELLICGFGEVKNLSQNNLGELSPEQFKNTLLEVKILVIPSAYDSFNISALEAMACGTPVIISNRCGLSKYLIDGSGCFIVNYGNETMLAQRIDELILDFKLYIKMSNEARAIAQKFLWSKVILDYKDIYLATAA